MNRLEKRQRHQTSTMWCSSDILQKWPRVPSSGELGTGGATHNISMHVYIKYIPIDFGGVTQVTPFSRQKISDPVKSLENEKTK